MYLDNNHNHLASVVATYIAKMHNRRKTTCQHIPHIAHSSSLFCQFFPLKSSFHFDLIKISTTFSFIFCI